MLIFSVKNKTITQRVGFSDAHFLKYKKFAKCLKNKKSCVILNTRAHTRPYAQIKQAFSASLSGGNYEQVKRSIGKELFG